MSRTMIRQVQFVPLAALLVIVVTGALMPGYFSSSQHMSELGILDHPAARVFQISVMLAGASVVLFGIGLKMSQPKAFNFTALAAVAFGIAHFSGAVFPTGSPLHGLYGLSLFYLLVPPFFAAELPVQLRSPFIVKVSLIASLLSACYMWFLFSGLESHEMRGATQRFGALVIFGWYPVASYWLLRASARSSKNAVADFAGASR